LITVLQRATTNQMGSAFSGAFCYKLMDGQGRVLGGVTVGDPNSENLFIQPIDGTFIVSV
jgi:hypothetical protein